MNLTTIYHSDPWDWPDETAGIIRETLVDQAAEPDLRLMAVEMAGDSVVVNDKLAGILLALIGNKDEPAKLRAKAAISLGPALEHSYIYEFDDPDDILVSEQVFNEIQASLQKMYHDAEVPEKVRISILEAAVRAPQDWHQGAVKAAFAADDEDWKLTAVFCMRFIKGFDSRIVEALESENRAIRYQAVIAAGNWGPKAAWPFITDLLADPGSEKSMLLAAIEAAAGFEPSVAIDPLERLLNTDDEDIIDAVHESLAMLGASGYFR